ncbi:acetyl-CoA acetyltransferase [Nocardioides sp. Root1257]|uniref:acetyl-CoA C-acyltransferase n=1 Tax=unclassified Nocardioides TaxID=2615069 RepID=UPI0006F67537|nr:MULTISPECIES: acetyl-CoA C-acyltransferase [unclassified Nocardioides]KQW42681.1 acetyl-CoA acetyltransferase [Nocardioides sp. Root1257]KRC39939.1 acetyl-CoA acetyltransferase [Nocardioides sp. Root224]
MRDAVIVDAVRTPIGKGRPNGALHQIHPADLLARSLDALIDRTGIDPVLVDDVIAGCVTQIGEQALNIGRTGLLAAGFPESVAATTVDRQCGSSQQAVHFAAHTIMAGGYDIAIACGVESMSRVPMGSDTPEGTDVFGSRFDQRYADGIPHQGVAAELIAAKWNLSRQQLDEFALASHDKAHRATVDGAFANELIKMDELAQDEGIRVGGTMESMANLAAVFYDAEAEKLFPQLKWVVTAGSASQISDASCAMLITSSETAKELGLPIRARIHSAAVAGDDPVYRLTALIPATQKVLKSSGLSISDIGAFEISEAFSPVPLAWQAETGADLSKVNQRGGAIALGHPVGASGARLMTTLLNTMEATGSRYGLQAMCEGGGVSNATIIELVS